MTNNPLIPTPDRDADALRAEAQSCREQARVSSDPQDIAHLLRVAADLEQRAVEMDNADPLLEPEPRIPDSVSA